MSAPPPDRLAMDRTQRRASWARALDKVRAAIKRRGPTAKAPSSLPASSAPAQEASTMPATRDNVAPTRPETTQAMPDIAPVDLAFSANASIEIDTDNDEPLLPIFSPSTGFSEDRTRELFAKYGMEYSGRRVPQEPPSKIRRIEKPIRVRVHWTCHECRRQFGAQRTCSACGHRRCRDCLRHPPKRIKQIVEETRQQLEHEERVQQGGPVKASMPDPPTTTSLPLQPAAATSSFQATQPSTQGKSDAMDPKESSRTQAPPVTGIPLDQAVEIDNEENLSLPGGQFPVYARPRALVSTVAKPTDRPLAPHTEAPLVRAVQRVYRKPRHRVRYTCERCDTLFENSDRCIECGHERCQNCNREPPKRAATQYDPVLVRATEARIARYGAPGRITGLSTSPG